MIATTHGLDSITVGALAAVTGVSKSGILTVFGNREAIQVSAVDAARDIYRETVLKAAYEAAPGVPRLQALMGAWVRYLEDGVFPGGCFIAATAAEYGRRTGSVGEAVRQLKRDWLTLLETELRVAGSPDPAGDAFVVDALLMAGNTRRELFSDDGELDRARVLALAVLDRLPGAAR